MMQLAAVPSTTGGSVMGDLWCWADRNQHRHQCLEAPETGVGLCREHYEEIYGTPCK